MKHVAVRLKSFCMVISDQWCYIFIERSSFQAYTKLIEIKTIFELSFKSLTTNR